MCDEVLELVHTYTIQKKTQKNFSMLQMKLLTKCLSIKTTQNDIEGIEINFVQKNSYHIRKKYSIYSVKNFIQMQKKIEKEEEDY